MERIRWSAISNKALYINFLERCNLEDNVEIESTSLHLDTTRLHGTQHIDIAHRETLAPDLIFNFSILGPGSIFPTFLMEFAVQFVPNP